MNFKNDFIKEIFIIWDVFWIISLFFINGYEYVGWEVGRFIGKSNIYGKVWSGRERDLE